MKQHILSSLQMWKFFSPSRAARNLFGKTQIRPQTLSYILFELLILSTCIHDSQSLCVPWTKNKTEGLPWSETMWAGNHVGGSGCGRQPRNGVRSRKPHFLPTFLPSTPAGIGKGFENENEAFSCVSIFSKSELQMHDRYSCTNGN